MKRGEVKILRLGIKPTSNCNHDLWRPLQVSSNHNSLFPLSRLFVSQCLSTHILSPPFYSLPPVPGWPPSPQRYLRFVDTQANEPCFGPPPQEVVWLVQRPTAGGPLWLTSSSAFIPLFVLVIISVLTSPASLRFAAPELQSRGPLFHWQWRQSRAVVFNGISFAFIVGTSELATGVMAQGVVFGRAPAVPPLWLNKDKRWAHFIRTPPFES